MLRLTLVVLLVGLTGIAVSFPMSDENADVDLSHDHENEHGIGLKNGTCAEKAERVLKLLWQRYKARFAKRFISHVLERKRIEIFRAALERIHVHNCEADMGAHAYHCGLNELSDLSPEEMESRTGLIPDTRRSSENEFVASVPLSTLPTHVDWREKGYVTPVKNQGSCGSCWTFATTGTIEGQYFNKTQKLVSLSEQQFLDCASNSKYGNKGCNGGVVSRALQYAKDVGFEEAETDYPYEGKQKNCRASHSDAVPDSQVKSFVNVKRNCEKSLMEAVATVGPIAVAIYASEKNFQNYKSGVFSCTCKRTINHAVLLVGYGTENGKDYWLIKNSWGCGWGDKGYVKIARSPKNGYENCAITSQSTFALM